MYLHLGGGIVVSTASVLSICDMDNATWSHRTREFLRKAEEDHRVENLAEDIPRSFVVCAEGGIVTVYLSQLSSTTLQRRAETQSFE